MQVGNIGTELAEDASELTTFVSRDGGVTWKVAAKGSTSSDIGDQGSIIVMADNTQPTKDITMSIDGGVSFRQCEFTGGTKIDVRDVLVDPNATSTNFIIHGHELAYERAGDPIIQQLALGAACGCRPWAARIIVDHAALAVPAAIFAVDFSMMFPRRCQDVELAGCRSYLH